MKVFITKYAMTGGRIQERDLELWGHDGSRVWDRHQSYGLGKDAHTSEAAAKEAAEAMRSKRIESLQKQIAKLEKMKFVIVKGEPND
jgi:hypothetical protein